MLTLTDQNFDQEIQSSKKPILVDVWAIHCSPCLILTPILEKIARENEDRFILAELNLDEAPNTAKKYRIESVPTVILFKWGKPVKGFIGAKPEPIIKEWLQDCQKIIDKVMGKIEEIIKGYKEYAQKNGFRLNPDRDVVENLVAGLLANEKKYGKRYCPCRRVSGNQEEDRPKICPCAYHRAEIEKDGHCYCGLFVK